MTKSSVVLFCVSIISSVCTLSAAELQVSEQDLTFEFGKNQSFLVFLSEAVNTSLAITFNYSDGNNLNPLPEGHVIENGTTDKLEYSLTAHDPGHTTVLVYASPKIVDRSDAFIRVGVYKAYGWVVISTIIGVLYFICWSVSFYPQIYDNYKRKSVVGLNFDFLGLNLTGFIAYSVFNIGFRFVREVQVEYHSWHPTGVIPVEMNDVAFAVHATFATIVTIGQCFIYERGNQLISKMTVGVLAAIWATAGVFLLITALGINKSAPWLTFLYYFSNVKLGITLVKYMPQVYYNYKRKSTDGWSIGTVLLDFIGGLFSISQMFIIAYNFDDWYSLVGNSTKFGLGLASITFDIIFMVQHFIIYRKRPESDSLESTLIT